VFIPGVGQTGKWPVNGSGGVVWKNIKLTQRTRLGLKKRSTTNASARRIGEPTRVKVSPISAPWDGFAVANTPDEKIQASRNRKKIMQNSPQKKPKQRIVPRNPTEAAISCRPLSSSGSPRTSSGVMRNFSSQGIYIETSHNYASGTIVIMRMVHYPPMPSSTADESQPRSICLAEVKWQQALADETAIRYGIGLKYLD
jgi:hypothetical protein